MKRNKTIIIFLLSSLLLLSIVTDSFARVRIVIRPWWPRAIVVVPPHPPPPRPVPRPPKIPPKVGFVDLNIRPENASLYVDGEYRGIARNFSCSPDCLTLYRGRHTVSLKKEAYKTENVIIHVVPRKIIEMDVKLKLLPKERFEPENTYELQLEKTGYLVLQVEPQDASVYIDRNFYGISSQFIESQESIVLRSGVHKVEIVKPGYKTYTTEVEILTEKTKKLHISLKKTP